METLKRERENIYRERERERRTRKPMLEESMAEGLFDEEYEEDVKSSPMPDAF